LELVSVTRRFIRQGNLTVMEKGESAPQHIILFDDLLLVTKQKLNARTGKFSYEVRAQVLLTDARIVVVADTEGCCIVFVVTLSDVHNAFELIDSKKSWKFVAATELEMNSWIKELKSCKKNIQRRQYGGSPVLQSPSSPNMNSEREKLKSSQQEEAKRKIDTSLLKQVEVEFDDLEALISSTGVQ
jgi:hypothetical protein